MDKVSGFILSSELIIGKAKRVFWGRLILMIAFSSLINYRGITAGGAEIAGSREPCRVIFGYWNDNMDYEKYFEGLKYGLDDYVTASFRLKGCLNSDWEADLLLNVITNRSGGYRTDLLTGRVAKTVRISSGRLEIGGGIIGSGNFGGRGIQNGYHRTRGILEVELPYSFDRRTGGYLGAGYFHHDLRKGKLRAEMFGAGYVCPGVGIGSVRGGSILKYGHFELWTMKIRPSAMVYHKTYFVSGEPFKPIFHSGLGYGVMVIAEVTSSFGICWWTVSNQYRNDQGQIGATFIFGGSDQGGDDYGMIMFP